MKHSKANLTLNNSQIPNLFQIAVSTRITPRSLVGRSVLFEAVFFVVYFSNFADSNLLANLFSGTAIFKDPLSARLNTDLNVQQGKIYFYRSCHRQRLT